jgi:hypothetical protein
MEVMTTTLTTTEAKLREILVATGVSHAEQATLFDAFFVFNPIDFAKQLHRTAGVADSVKGQLLALKISVPPAEAKAQQDHVIEQAMNAAMFRFWNRLATEKAHA